MLQQGYGEDCLSRTQCHEWYKRFKSGRTSIEDDPKSGRIYERKTIARQNRKENSALVRITLISNRHEEGLLHNSTAQLHDFGHRTAESGNRCITCNLKMTNAL